MPRAGEGGDEAVGQEGLGKANVEPEEVAPWEMVTREALPEVDAEKRVEEVALQPAVRCCSELEDVWLYEEETWAEVVRVDVAEADRWVRTLNISDVPPNSPKDDEAWLDVVSTLGLLPTFPSSFKDDLDDSPRSRDSPLLRLALLCVY